MTSPFILSRTQTPDGDIPLKAGPHSWLWKLSEVRSWPDIIDRHKALGFVGAHLHSDGGSLRRTLTLDLRHRFVDAGLDLGVSIAFDTGTRTNDGQGKEISFVGTPKEKLLGHILGLADLLGGNGTIGLNWEMRWENERTHRHRRDDAQWIATEAKRQLAGTGISVWDAPWWRPDLHGSSPTDEFGELVDFRIPQTYGVYSRKVGTVSVPALQEASAKFVAEHPGLPRTFAAYMTTTAREKYATRRVRKPLAWGFQSTSSAGADKVHGQCLRDYPVSMWWHFLRLYEQDNASSRAVFRARKIMADAFPAQTVNESVGLYQAAHGLTADQWVGRKGVDAVRLSHPDLMRGY